MVIFFHKYSNILTTRMKKRKNSSQKRDCNRLHFCFTPCFYPAESKMSMRLVTSAMEILLSPLTSAFTMLIDDSSPDNR